MGAEEKQGFIQPLSPRPSLFMSLCLLLCFCVSLYLLISLSHTGRNLLRGSLPLRKSLLLLRARHPRAGCGFLVSPALTSTGVRVWEGVQLKNEVAR